MALFHFHVTQVKRSAGQSAVAAAAYRAGEKLYSEYYGENNDYTRKGGVICSDILLPTHAPPGYADRQTLWNAVEHAERGKKAQLAYSFDIALQNELSLDENIALVQQFLSEQFVGRGMIVDYAVHQPDNHGAGISNPHFHVLCPIRPLDENGKWGAKQRRVCREDENGDRILGDDGKPLFDAVPTTDWGNPETLEAWRQAWADLCNAKFAEKGLACRIDNRSYLRQSLELLPSVHEGPSVRAMEKRGISTEKGELNRWIQNTNAAIKDIRKKIASLLDWLKDVQEKLDKPQTPNLMELLSAYYTNRNAGAWSDKAKSGNVKQFSEAINYLTANELYTVEALKARISSHNEKMHELKDRMDGTRSRMKEIDELLRYADTYARFLPVYKKLNAIKWKGEREKFQEAHKDELAMFYMARRKLKAHVSPEGKLPVSKWKRERAKLQEVNAAAYAEYKPIREDFTKLLQMKSCVDAALRRLEHGEQMRAKNRQYEQER